MATEVTWETPVAGAKYSDLATGDAFVVATATNKPPLVWIKTIKGATELVSGVESSIGANEGVVPVNLKVTVWV